MHLGTLRWGCPGEYTPQDQSGTDPCLLPRDLGWVEGEGPSVTECIFCAIVRGDAQGDFVYQDGSLVAFKDINPMAPVHLLIIPRKHIATLFDLEQADEGLIGHICATAAKLSKDNGLSEKGFRLVANCGAEAGQSVFHIHFHLLGGRPMRWPPG